MAEFPSRLEDRIELLAADCLSPREVLSLLNELEPGDPHWRMLSLLLLEERKWTHDFSALADQDCDVASEQVGACDEAARMSVTKQRSGKPWGVLAVAACLCLSFLAGRYWNDSLSTGIASTQIAGVINRVDALAVAEEPMMEIKAIGETRVLGIAEWENSFGPQATPLYEFDESQRSRVSEVALNEQMASIPPRVEKEMRRAGWLIEPRQLNVTIRLVGGQQLSLPLQDYRYRFIGRQVL
ncbi:MAG: hypothetical protein AAGJ83_03100 [Planctomycetota bacterium]